MPEAQLGRCIRSKEKGLLDKYDGLATAAGSETRPRYYIQYRHATMMKPEESVRPSIILCGPQKVGKALLRQAGEFAVGSPKLQRAEAAISGRHMSEEVTAFTDGLPKLSRMNGTRSSVGFRHAGYVWCLW